jgi:leucyl aminopeptidase
MFKMKKIFSFLAIIMLPVLALHAQSAEITLREILNQINKDSLQKTVQDMQNFESRFCAKTMGHNKKVAQYLVDRLISYGIEDAHIDSFPLEFTLWGQYYAQYMYNVLGTLQGKGETHQTVIIGAHLDAIARYDGVLAETAPGADDNATGCAVMIETARLLYENHIIPYHNIDFMAFDAEEVGLKGAHYDAQKRRDANENVIVMINNDMVGYSNAANWKVMLHWYDNALDVTDKAKQALIEHTTVTPIIPESADNVLRANSDSYAYFARGYKATFAIENPLTPNYHTIFDLAEFLNFEFCRQIARMNFVLLDYYAGINLPLSVNDNDKPIDRFVEAFPNPAKDFIRVHHYNDIIINKIEIYDVTGKLMTSLQTVMPQQNVIYLNNYGKGVYFMRIYTDKGAVNKKIIIN